MQTYPMVQKIRLFLLSQAALFAVASLIHSGVLISGYEHAEARVAEGVIAIVLFAGLVTSLGWPAWTRRAGLIVQWFALLGTFVGLFTILIGVGPRTTLDLTIHALMIVLLVWGLVSTTRAGLHA